MDYAIVVGETDKSGSRLMADKTNDPYVEYVSWTTLQFVFVAII